MIGILGNVIFTVSSFKVLTFSGLTKDVSVRTVEHEVIGMKPKTEFIGPDLKPVSFDMRLDANLGVNPQAEIDNLEYLCENGIICVLILGEKVHGEYLITGISQSFDHFYRDGTLLKASINVKLKEHN